MVNVAFSYPDTYFVQDHSDADVIKMLDSLPTSYIPILLIVLLLLANLFLCLYEADFVQSY